MTRRAGRADAPRCGRRAVGAVPRLAREARRWRGGGRAAGHGSVHNGTAPRAAQVLDDAYGAGPPLARALAAAHERRRRAARTAARDALGGEDGLGARAVRGERGGAAAAHARARRRALPRGGAVRGVRGRGARAAALSLGELELMLGGARRAARPRGRPAARPPAPARPRAPSAATRARRRRPPPAGPRRGPRRGRRRDAAEAAGGRAAQRLAITCGVLRVGLLRAANDGAPPAAPRRARGTRRRRAD